MNLFLRTAPKFSKEQINFLEHIFFNRLMSINLLLEVQARRLADLRTELYNDDICLKEFFACQIYEDLS